MPYANDKRILDIACGTGYGIGILKQRARFIAGVDIDDDALAQSRSECDTKAAALFGDGLRLPFADGSFDLVTSFETLEHIYERQVFLEELHRVLKPDGMLILSTPNAYYTKPVNGKPSNPFHIFEYTPGELLSELSDLFVVDLHLGQTLDPGIKITPFWEAQQRLPKDLSTQTALYSWKIFNRFPVKIRESLSHLIWKKPFYPMEQDYIFSSETLKIAPVQLAVCKKIL